MQDIITAKAKQLPKFRQSLVESGDSYLAEATFDKFWASGLSVEDTAKVNPRHFPGCNQLGRLLMDIRLNLLEIFEAESCSHEGTDPPEEGPNQNNNEVSHSEVEHYSDDSHSMIAKEKPYTANDAIPSASYTSTNLQKQTEDNFEENVKKQKKRTMSEVQLQNMVSAQTHKIS